MLRASQLQQSLQPTWATAAHVDCPASRLEMRPPVLALVSSSNVSFETYISVQMRADGYIGLQVEI